ncbi:MAG: histidine kinase [Candidatus Methanogaster sp.]|uniref:Histidine kinase n=1 Tax=Candidatus Methanogaster sp. TaxID=3386292 RepID=A0AC61L580_9EURY|nr:MAG: histidine kinase [ANME-2 cluster archaeon]
MIMKIAEKMIRDVMTRGVTTVTPDTHIKEIAERMANQCLSGVAVIGAQGDALGFISEMDLVKVLHKPDLKQLTAEDIMSSRLIAVAPDAPLGRAAKIMSDGHIHRLLILSEKGVGASQRPVGILCTSDIVREVSKAG